MDNAKEISVAAGIFASSRITVLSHYKEEKSRPSYLRCSRFFKRLESQRKFCHFD